MIESLILDLIIVVCAHMQLRNIYDFNIRCQI